MNASRAGVIAYWFATGFITLEFAAVTVASWLLRPQTRTLGVLVPSRREPASLRLEARPAA